MPARLLPDDEDAPRRIERDQQRRRRDVVVGAVFRRTAVVRQHAADVPGIAPGELGMPQALAGLRVDREHRVAVVVGRRRIILARTE